MPQYTAPLSIMDQIMPAFHTAMWLTLPCADTETSLSTLQAGLSRTIRQLPFLSGEVYGDPENYDRTLCRWNDDSPSITWEEVDGTGLPSYQQLAKQSMPLHDLEHDFRPTAIKESMTQKIRPALVVSYTRVEGGLILLLAPHHHVMDGGGTQLLFDSWARNTRALVEGLTNMDVKSPVRWDEPLRRDERLRQALLSAMASPRDSTSPTPSSADNKPAISPHVSKSQLPPSANAPSPISRRLFRFSITKLSALRTSLQAHTTSPDFSLNTLLTALIWQTVSDIRFKRLKHTDSALETEVSNLTSELTVAVDMRQRFEIQGLLDKEEPWLGNLAFGMMPKPCLPFSELATEQEHLLHLDLGKVGSITVSPVVTLVINAITKGLAELTPENTARKVLDIEHRIADATAMSNSTFSYRSLHDMRELFNGLSLIVTAWSNFEYYPDFGFGIGRPQFVRLARTHAFDGVVILLPRKREGAGWSAEEVDAMEVFLNLREDDMVMFEDSETVRKLLVEEQGPS